MKYLGFFLLAIGVLSVIVVLMENRFVRQMIYPAPAIAVSSPPAGLKKVLFSGASGTRIEAWLHEQEDSPVLLYFHGNGENLETMRQSGLFDELRKLNVTFCALDYPGYGNSTGTPSEKAILDASAEAIRYLSENFPEKKLVLCGWSLGAAVALQSAAQHSAQVQRVIAMSAWSSLPDVGAFHFPQWMIRSLLHERYDSMDAARKIRCPVLLIHGELDDLIPVSHGEKLAWEIAGEVRWIKVADTGHNDLLSRNQVWTEIATFLRE